MRHILLQNATVLLQNATVIANWDDFITKCDVYYKLRQYSSSGEFRHALKKYTNTGVENALHRCSYKDRILQIVHFQSL